MTKSAWRAIPTTTLVLGGKDPVAAGLPADDLAGLEFPVAGGVDLDHGIALAARERDLRPLDRAERTDMAHRALQRAGSGRPDLHVVAADEQFLGAGGRAIGGDSERRAAEPHRAAGDLHRQHDGFADEAMHEGGGGIVIDIAGRAD